MGFGLGAFFFNFVLVAVVNPNNEKQDANRLFPESVGNNLPLALQILAAIYAATGIIGVVLTIPAKKDAAEINSTTALVAKEKEEDELKGHSHASKFALQLAIESSSA
jgi:hypothetical protein